MPQQNIIAGIDIGNSTIKTIIADIDNETLNPRIIGFGVSKSKGLRKGAVVDMTDVTKSVGDSISQAEVMSGVKLKRAYISINGRHIKGQISRGVVAVSRADNEISQGDIDRVIEAASTVGLPLNREKIHVIPKSFIIDGQERVGNPIGMKGVRVEADVLIIDGLSPYIHNIAKCVNENNIEVADFVFAPLASSKAILNKEQKEHGVISLDFGGAVSSLSMFREGNLLHTAVMPIGSKHITEDLAVALRTSINLAERAKVEFGYIGTGKITKKEQIDLSNIIGEEDFIIPKKNIGKVIEARVYDLFDMINSEIRKVGNTNNFPAGVVISGGGANLPGLIKTAREKLNLPVKLANYRHFEGIGDQVEGPSFSVAVGLVLWGLENESSNSRFKRSFSFGSGVSIKKAIDWLKNFLP